MQLSFYKRNYFAEKGLELYLGCVEKLSITFRYLDFGTWKMLFKMREDLPGK